MTRIGKIARLPDALRDELNRRLREGESGPRLLAWLNSLPDVQAVLTEQFGGRPINPQNLSDWRQGGYWDWITHQHTLELAQRLAAEAANSHAQHRRSLADTLTLWLAASHVLVGRRVAAVPGPEGCRLLRKLCNDLAVLRRHELNAERLRLQEQSHGLDLAQQRLRAGQDYVKWAMWVKHPEKIPKPRLRWDDEIRHLTRIRF